jgi:threonine/homoserine/homoserine lactone efflux protein
MYKTVADGPPMVGSVVHFLALVGFAFVNSVTPGPNNVLLWASGAAFGIRRTVRHIVGTTLGVGAMALAVAAGLGAVLTAAPAMATGMKLLGSIYLLFLAVQIGRAGALRRAALARPLGVVQAAAFQVINPKAWVFCLGAMTTFRPPELPITAGSVVVAATMMAMIVPTAALWAAGGDALSRLLAGEGAQRQLSVVLGLLIAGTVVTVWL